MVAQRVQQAVGEAFVAGFRWIMAVSAALALAGAMAAAVFVEAGRLSEGASDTG